MKPLSLCPIPNTHRFSVPRSLLFLAILAVGLLLSSSEASAQILRGVALVDAVKFPPKAAADAHARLRSALEKALSPKDWYLATERPIPDCGDGPECMAKIAADTNTRYVLRLSGQKARDYGYDITLNLFTTATGYAHTSLATCDFCDPATMSRIVSETAAEMLTTVLKEEASKEKASQKGTVTAPVPPGGAQSPALALEPSPPAPEPQTASRPWIPWTMVGVGAFGLVYGGWALIENGKSSSGNSYPGSSALYGHDTYSSKAIGIGALAVGGALFAVGGAWIGWAYLNASPNHVALSLRF